MTVMLTTDTGLFWCKLVTTLVTGNQKQFLSYIGKLLNMMEKKASS